MKTQFAVALWALFSLAAGGIAGHSVQAQSHPSAYVNSEIEVTNADAYSKEYVPLANKALAESGQKRLASGGRTISIAGAPPAPRVVVSMFDSLDQAAAAYSSPAYLEARKVGDRYGKLRIFAVEGVPQ
jgi:uncharacterized protein (DUF1330 family)